ncbi:MAG TPA: hypothetical protein VIV40_32650, partial [Kofleriaceae bacterium]
MTSFRLALAITAVVARAAAAEAPPPPRAMPNYDGREPAPTTAGDVLRWVPRVVLFPLRVVVDYGVR